MGYFFFFLAVFFAFFAFFAFLAMFPSVVPRVGSMQVNIDVHASRVHHNCKIDTSRFEEGKRPPRQYDRMKASRRKNQMRIGMTSGLGRPVRGASGRFANEPEAVALDRALRFESRPNSRPPMVHLCRASCFCRLLSSCRCCRPSRRLRRLTSGRRHAGTATASCRAIISHRITAFRITPRKPRFRARPAATGGPGISIQPQVITDTMATGTISAGLAFTAVATMAAPSARAGHERRSGRSGIAADQEAGSRHTPLRGRPDRPRRSGD